MLLVKPALPVARHPRRGSRPVRRPDRRLPGERRVRDDRGGGRATAGSTGDGRILEVDDIDPPGRRRLRHHLRRGRPRDLDAGDDPMTRPRRSGVDPGRAGRAGARPLPGRGEQPRPRVPLGGPAAARARGGRTDRASGTPTAAGTSTTSAPGARRSSGMPTRLWSRPSRDAALDGFALGATSPREIVLGEAIRAAMPSLERLRFTSSGTEAVMSAIRLARGATGRDLVLKFAGGYHGHSDGASRRGGLRPRDARPAGFGRSHRRDRAGHDRRRVQRRRPRSRPPSPPHRGRIAAVIVEPVAANVGVVAPAPRVPRGAAVDHRKTTARSSSSTR